MSRTFLRQDIQIKNSDAYNDSLASGVALESTATSIEDDLNGLRSQLAKFLNVAGSPNWYDAVPTVNSKQRSLLQLNTDLNDIEEKRLLCRANVLTDVTVGPGANYVVLNVAGLQAPTRVAAVASTVNGAVVAQSALSGASFLAHELVELAAVSADPLHPRNLCVIRDANTGQPIQSSGRDVFGLLQYESTGVDGASFNDVASGNRVKISFVRPNGGFDDLEAVPVADIENRAINYNYVFRINLDAIPEDVFLSDANFVDQSASVDVTLSNAADNQGSTAVAPSTDINIDVANSNFWNFRDASQQNLLQIFSDTVGSGSEVAVTANVDILDVDAIVNDFASGVTVASAGAPIGIGVSSGLIGTTGANDMYLRSGAELYLDDTNQVGSTWAQVNGIKLSDTQAEWDAFEAEFGEVSLLNAITSASQTGGGTTRVKGVATVTAATIAADSDVSGPSGANNLSADLPAYDLAQFVSTVDVYVNGQLQYNGANASANNDVYPGTNAAIGELRFEYGLITGDVITTIVWS